MLIFERWATQLTSKPSIHNIKWGVGDVTDDRKKVMMRVVKELGDKGDAGGEEVEITTTTKTIKVKNPKDATKLILETMRE